jgi:hypothetical protein
MTDSAFTHIAFLLDRSGSMQSIATDTVGGFAAFIEEQRALPGRCTVSLAQFDTEYDEVFRDRPLAEVPPLTLQPRGSTALLDSIGRLVNETGARLAALPEDERPGTVIVGIMTDGLENASREFSHPTIKQLITKQTNTYGWQFLYMGANQDAIEVGTSLGVDAGMSVSYGLGAVDAAMRTYGKKAAGLRAAAAAGVAPAAARMLHAYTAEERLVSMGDESDAAPKSPRSRQSRPIDAPRPTRRRS